MAKTVLIAISTVLALSLVATNPVAADDGGILHGVSDDGEESSILKSVGETADFIGGQARGLYARAQAIDLLGDEEGWSTETKAEEVRSEVESNATLYESWLNSQLTASEDRDVLAVTIRNETSETTVYVVSDVSNGTYENVTAVNSTSRTVDETIELEGRAGRNAPDELAAFRERTVIPGDNVSRGTLGRFTTEYGGLIEVSFA